MSLFKIYRGDSDDLPGGKNPTDQNKMHDGYAYFCIDSGEFFIDVNVNMETENPQLLKRVQINALAATKLSNGVDTIEINQIALKNAIADVAHGGTGRNSLTVNAVLVGDGTNQIKLIPADLGAFFVDTANGEPRFGVLPVAQGGLGASNLAIGGILKGNGTGAVETIPNEPGVLFAATAGAPQFGTAPLTLGGTGATSASGARNNLNVYSKGETNTEITNAVALATTVAYPHTLVVDSWTAEGDMFVSIWNEPNLQCGKANNVPPLITYTSNLEEYSKIDHADADYEHHQIKFYIKEKPSSTIDIVIIDQM